MPLIGLTGGIGSGKSTVARHLASLGAVHLDADQLARDAVAPGTPGLARVRERFGDRVIAADGSLDRAALAAIVFADAEELADLNAIVHPEVGRLRREAIERVRRDDPDAVIVYDVPLLAEGGGRGDFDAVVVVRAPLEVRIRRLVDTRDMSREDAERRISAQATDVERQAIADVVIDTGGSLESTLRQADDLWAGLSRWRPGCSLRSQHDRGE